MIHTFVEVHRAPVEENDEADICDLSDVSNISSQYHKLNHHHHHHHHYHLHRVGQTLSVELCTQFSNMLQESDNMHDSQP